MKEGLVKILSLIIFVAIFFPGCPKKNRPPHTPYTPSGPSTGLVNTTYDFSSLAIDPETDSVALRFNWKESDTSDWSDWVPTEGGVTMSYSWSKPDNYYVKAQAKDMKEHTSEWSLPLLLIIANNLPPVPSIPSGPSTGYVDSIYQFLSSATDPDGDSITIRFDWGDGDTSDWGSLVHSGQTIVTSHSWNDSGFFYVKAQAKDKYENISNWSLPASILIKDTTSTTSGWICATASAPWESRLGHTTVVFDNKIWVIGGCKDATMYNDVWYSSDGVNWTCATASAEWIARAWHTSVVFENKIWVIGGWATTYPNRPVNDVWYSADGINWICATDSADWPLRERHTSVVYDNKIWVIGGYLDLNDVWYSSNGVDWVCATDSTSWLARQEHTSVVFDNKIWVLGGNGLELYNDVWYSSDGVNWTCATASAEWQARCCHTSVVFDDKIWVLGGLNLPVLFNDVWCTSNGEEWIKVSSPPVLWQPREGHTSVVFDNKIWVIGGSIGLPVIIEVNDVWYWDGSIGKVKSHAKR